MELQKLLEIRTKSSTTTSSKNSNDEINRGVIFKNCALFTDCISDLNNTQIDND